MHKLFISIIKKYINIRILKDVLSVFNFILALCISITCLNDYMHHSEDVLMGAILGIICAFITLFKIVKKSLINPKSKILKCRVESTPMSNLHTAPMSDPQSSPMFDPQSVSVPGPHSVSVPGLHSAPTSNCI